MTLTEQAREPVEAAHFSSTNQAAIRAELARVQDIRRGLADADRLIRTYLGEVLVSAYRIRSTSPVGLSFEEACRLAGVTTAAADHLMADAGFLRPIHKRRPRLQP
jgi:hypothetical protein